MGMLDNNRIRELRHAASLRQEDMAFLLGVGIASINRWEKDGSSLPTGLSRQVFEIMDRLAGAGVDLRSLPLRLRAEGSLAAVRWLFNQHAEHRPEM